MTIDGLAAGLLLVLPVVGHVVFWIGLVNRAHAIDLGHVRLHRLHRLHFTCIGLGTLGWLVGTGLFGPRWLLGGTFSDANLIVQGLALGFGGVAISWILLLVWRKVGRPPSQVIRTKSTLRNLEAEIGHPIRGIGPYQKLQYLPANQFLSLEILELELQLPRVPPAWDGLSIVHISDLHFTGSVDCSYFERLFQIASELKGDLVVFTGDLLDSPEFIKWFPRTFGQLQAPLGCYFILGNHDREWGDVIESRNALANHGWIDATRGCEILNHRGHPLAICGDERPWMGEPANWSTAPQNAFRLLLSHTPDHFARAQSDHVDLMLAGHTHGGQVCLPIIGPVYAPSRYGVRYASGTFWSAPTLMHVSKGISGRHPWRWNCPPELGRLVLRSNDREE